jgi:serine/threonine-protein kinase
LALTPGTRLGPYEVSAQIGEGGMGQVYRATDTNLKRAVAIKVLPESVASDAERLARFQREAEVLASLNHPNIAAIYGLERSGGTTALVMELVEGPTLADRIAQGAIPFDEALPIATQVADALAAAHERGIVHRDLKPANVKVRPDGAVKVLDFGLAKALDQGSGIRDQGSGHLADSPTITSPAMTQAGMVLGTAAYMSPEQARGKAVDRRADIWAFGCVLYEMLTARRAFAGDEVSDTLASVLAREPDWTLLPATVSPVLGTYLRRCLHKESRQRIHDIADMRLALEGAFEAAAGNAGARESESRWHGRRLALAGAAMLVIGGTSAGTAVWWMMRPSPPRVLRTEVTTTGATALSISGFDRDLAITPDGSRVVYRSNNQLLVRALDRLEPAVLGGLGAPRGVFVSPDGESVGFFDRTTMMRVSLTGGPPLTITQIDGSGSRGATWGTDGTIVYATDTPSTGLQGVSAAGGDATLLTKPDRERGEADHLWPEFLPGGQAVLFTIAAASGGLANAQIAVFDVKTGTSKVLVRGGHHAHYVPTGHLVYGAGGTLRAVAFDHDRLEVAGTPVPVLEQVLTSVEGVVDAAFAANGTMVYVPGSGGPGAARSLVWVDRMGREEPVTMPLRAYSFPRISPDGTRVALAVLDQERDIWIWDFAREELSRFTFGAGVDQYPLWSPDGKRLIFASAGVGGSNLFWQAADGTGAVEQLTEGPTILLPLAMTPDGNRIIVREVGQQDDLMLVPLQPPRRPQPLVETTFGERNAEIAPDGRWLAYESNESGREEIYVRPFPDVGGGRWQVSTGGGRMPLWSRNGQELFYGSPDGALMGVLIEPGPSWRSSTSTRILQGQLAYSGFGRAYDIAPDGRRFLMVREGGGNKAAPQNLVVVQNWLVELKRLVPTN